MSDVHRPVPDGLPLGINEVHIWRAGLAVSTASLCVLSEVLSPDELNRAGQFHLAHHRQCFIAARGILRYIVSRYARTSPSALQLRKRAGGKPFIASCGIEFSVSHSGALALYAIARRTVGIDIEHLDQRLATPDVAQCVFTDEEMKQWHALPVKMRLRGFFDCWTSKEAYLKGCGEGISSASVKELQTWDAGSESRVLCSGGRSWLLRTLRPAAGYSGAVAVEGGNMAFAFFGFDSDGGISRSQA